MVGEAKTEEEEGVIGTSGVAVEAKEEEGSI
jgi:hypothetical protein